MQGSNRTTSQALTQKLILAAAHDLFRREGYSATSVDRIAEKAGFSKGAFYSNFDSKEAVLLAVLDMARPAFEDLLAAIASAANDEIIDLLVAWADDRCRNGNWILAILEHTRSARRGSRSVIQQEAMLRDNWRRLGEVLLSRFPGLATTAETLGALLHEIAYAPAMTIVSSPTAGELMRLAATTLLHGNSDSQSVVPDASEQIPRRNYAKQRIKR